MRKPWLRTKWSGLCRQNTVPWFAAIPKRQVPPGVVKRSIGIKHGH